MSETLEYIRDNLRRIMKMKEITSYRELSEISNVSEDTIKKWFTKKESYPRLKTLDKLCDSLHIHTSDLFIPNSEFKHTYTDKNDSQKNFRRNFNIICLNKGLTKIQDRIDLFFEENRDLYNSYFRKDRVVPIYIVEQVVDYLNQHYKERLRVSDFFVNNLEDDFHEKK